MQATATALTIGTRRVAVAGDYRHIGVLRAGREIIAECPHQHTNRDMGSRRNGTSASDCIRHIARAAAKNDTHPAIRQGAVQDQRNAWQGLTRGFPAPASVIAQARVECAERADALDATIGRLADLLASDAYRADRDRFAH